MGATKLMTAAGGGITLDAASTATDKTITIPADNGTLVYANSSGNVGIGTSSPAFSSGGGLHVNVAGAGPSIVHLTTGNQGTTASDGLDVKFYAGDTTFWNYETGYMAFATSNAERARIDTSGRLLVGTTTSPSNTGGVIVSNNELFVYNIPTTASGANCNISSGEGNRFYRSTSALKYKQDIRDIESIDISQIRPVRYKSKCENDDQTKDHFGIIADEVHEAGITELVSYGVDGEIEGFQYDRLTVVLLKAIQELKAELDAAKADIAALKGTA